jgi:hypothetical protein
MSGCFSARYNNAGSRARSSRQQKRPIEISKRQNPVFLEAGGVVASR